MSVTSRIYACTSMSLAVGLMLMIVGSRVNLGNAACSGVDFTDASAITAKTDFAETSGAHSQTTGGFEIVSVSQNSWTTVSRLNSELFCR